MRFINSKIPSFQIPSFLNRAKKGRVDLQQIEVAKRLSALTFSLPKLGESVESNADSCEVDLESMAFAIADGVSQSFNPRTWSHLVSEFAVRSRGLISVSEIENLALELPQEIPDDEPWYISEMRERGSQSTLLYVEFDLKDSGTVLNLQSVGDCCAFHIRAGKVIDSWPFCREFDFPTRPAAVMTKSPFVLGEVARHRWELTNDDEIVLATDAMSRFLVKAIQRNEEIEVTTVFPFLDRESGADELFFEWAESARRDGFLEDDDLTVLHIFPTGVHQKI
jgi:hypothetical protein